MHARISPDIRGLSIALAVCMLLALLFPVRAHAQSLGQSFTTGLGVGAGIAVGQAFTQAMFTQAGGPANVAGMINWAAPNVADLICLPKAIPPCPCGQSMGSKGCQPDPSNRYMCPCMDPRGVTGKCVTTGQCRGMSFIGLDGQSMGLGGQLGGIVGQLMSVILQQLMQQ